MMRRILGAFGLLAVLSGCSGGGEPLACEPPDRYATARSIDPVRVPDDLSPPDETEALRVPSLAVGAGRPCLESPPQFFEGGVGGAERRPAQDVPAVPDAAPEFPDGDREITN